MGVKRFLLKEEVFLNYVNKCSYMLRYLEGNILKLFCLEIRCGVWKCGIGVEIL